MPVPTEYSLRHVYHFTHVDNLRDILRNGLLSYNEQTRLGLHHRSIALSHIQARRAAMQVPCGPGGVVHDYVPLYFCMRSSMLLSVVNSKNCDQQFLIYFAFPMALFDAAPVVFTDAAANAATSPNFFTDPADLSRLHWGSIDSQKWTLGEEGNRQRMAEVLVQRSLSVSECSYLVVWNESIKKHVLNIYQEAGIAPPPVRFDSKHYFTKYPHAPNESLVTGPGFTKRSYTRTVEATHQGLESGQSPRYASITQLLQALRADLSALPETAELVGLQSQNEMHTEDVGTHTRRVVEKLVASQEFANLNEEDKLLVELSAFLHDIGKGPKSRWAAYGGVQQVDPDHPVKGLPMVQRILCEEVQTCDPRSAKAICKLVCYHDLVGDIVARGRDPRQLEDIAENERDLDMLIALAKADMASVREYWGTLYVKEIEDLRSDVILKLKAPVEKEFQGEEAE